MTNSLIKGGLKAIRNPNRKAAKLVILAMKLSISHEDKILLEPTQLRNPGGQQFEFTVLAFRRILRISYVAAVPGAPVVQKTVSDLL